MPDVILTERDQHLLRTLMESEPVPGSPIPERRVLELIGELVPSDEVIAVLRVNGGPLLSFAGVPSGAGDFEDEPSRWCTLKVGTMHWSRHPREAEACGRWLARPTASPSGFATGRTPSPRSGSSG